METMLRLEQGIAKDIVRRFKVPWPTPPHSGSGAQPDPVFLILSDWQLGEAGCESAPSIAAATRTATDRPERAALADLAVIKPPDTYQTWSARCRDAAVAFYETTGYPASTAGAIVAVCDMYFGRIFTGHTHPIAGAGCIGWYSWSTEQTPTRPTVKACAEAFEQWCHDPGARSLIEQSILELANRWQKAHPTPRIPTIASRG